MKEGKLSAAQIKIARSQKERDLSHISVLSISLMGNVESSPVSALLVVTPFLGI